MTAVALQPSTPKAALWTGRILSGIAALFLTFDGVIHVLKPEPVIQAFAQLNVPLVLSVPLGVIELVIVALTLVRRTQVVGALLLTAYLGGATAIQVRANAEVFPVVFPAIIGTIFWVGLVLRREDIRSII